ATRTDRAGRRDLAPIRSPPTCRARAARAAPAGCARPWPCAPVRSGRSSAPGCRAALPGRPAAPRNRLWPHYHAAGRAGRRQPPRLASRPAGGPRGVSGGQGQAKAWGFRDNQAGLRTGAPPAQWEHHINLVQSMCKLHIDLRERVRDTGDMPTTGYKQVHNSLIDTLRPTPGLRVLVTAGASGIGAAVARALRETGARV